MEWILDHLQLVIAAIIIVGYLLRGLTRNAPEEAPGQEGSSQSEADVGEAERTRRIQEEIRRRILERQRESEHPEPRPVIIFGEREDDGYDLQPQERRPPVSPPPIPRALEPESGMAAVLERQRSLDDQLRAIRAARAAAVAPGARSPWGEPLVSTARTRGHGVLGSLREDLSGVQALRKAVLLKEVLGEPIGLRPGPPHLPRR